MNKKDGMIYIPNNIDKYIYSDIIYSDIEKEF